MLNIISRLLNKHPDESTEQEKPKSDDTHSSRTPRRYNPRVRQQTPQEEIAEIEREVSVDKNESPY